MNEQTVELLRDLSTQLGTTVEHIMYVLTKQAPISGITNFCVNILFLIIGIILVVLGSRYFGMENASESYLDLSHVYVPLYLVGGVMGVVSVVLLTVTIPDLVTSLTNPEYWALERILNVVQ